MDGFIAGTQVYEYTVIFLRAKRSHIGRPGKKQHVSKPSGDGRRKAVRLALICVNICLSGIMRNSLFILGMCILLAGILPVHGQWTGELSSGDRRAIRAYHRAEEALRKHDPSSAIDNLQRAIERDKAFAEAHMLLAEIYFETDRFAESIPSYKKAIDLDSHLYRPAKYRLSMALYRTGRYADAAEMAKRFLDMGGYAPAMGERAEDLLTRSDFANKLKNNPVTFQPVNPGPAINTPNAEYSPALTADEQTLIFTRKKPRKESPSPGQTAYYEDFYISHYKEGEWTPAKNLGPPLNTPGNEGAQTITADGRHLYFAACNRPDVVGRCDIYYSRREGGRWTTPVNPGRPLNSTAWDSQPSVSADGSVIYFTSSREGSIGPMDIWKATRDEHGHWTEPVNMGPTINTTGNEMSPFIHHDNATLYFASDGHPGMGGLDIFYSRRDDNGQWSKPVNIGYPINTHGDEFAMIVGASGTTAWFSSDMEGGYGDADLYTFDLYPEARPLAHTYMRGRVYDAETLEPLAAGFELFTLNDGRRITTATSDPHDGTFLVAIPVGKELALNVSKTGYLFFSAHFSYADPGSVAEPYLRDIELQPIKTGEPVVLKNIFFEFDSYDLEKASKPELDKLYHFLLENPSVHIEIGGHTDSIGSDTYNITLSENRAGSVRSYLIEAGVSPERITYKGYGDTRPVATNETPEGRAMNRRTEFRVVHADHKDQE